MHISHLIDLLTDLRDRLPGDTQVFIMDADGCAGVPRFQLDYAKRKIGDDEAYTLVFDRVFLRKEG